MIFSSFSLRLSVSLQFSRFFFSTVIAVFCLSSGLMAQQSWKKTVDEQIFHDAPFQQCHASTVAEIAGGKIMVAWFGGTHEGNNDVCIWSSVLSNEKWSEPRKLADGKTDGDVSYPLWNPVLFMTKSGKLFLYYKMGRSPREWWGMEMSSVDGGKTWTEAVRLPDGIFGPIKNKPVELAGGVILSPSSTETTKRWKAHVERSVDGGQTWTNIPVDKEGPYDVIQPSVMTYEDGRIQLLCRSKNEAVLESWSSDKGLTWSPLTKTSLLNPNSGTDGVSLYDGTQLFVYNPQTPGKDWFNGRYKLAVATSADGKIWTDQLLLEDGKETEEFSYPAVIQSQDGKIHITYTYDRKNIKYVVLERSR